MKRAYIRQSSWILYFLSAAGRTFQHGSSSVTLNFCGFCADPSAEDDDDFLVTSGAVGGRWVIWEGRMEEGEASRGGARLFERAGTGVDVDDAAGSGVAMGLTGRPGRFDRAVDIDVAGCGIGSWLALVGVFGLAAEGTTVSSPPLLVALSSTSSSALGSIVGLPLEAFRP
jgi:hypothetical protein